ncbi:MAG: hypothetical protein A2Y62_17070 [Candidatus Fischerbacteria bacterium RBG_13_37_8]|uniref:DUF4412 domain-containing protein n=1 Tax=Candidatus Fischerbacteria bacterium RBG_13_37_8 TaxID=1817863 RepID=A0A1F5VG94_9BACT|nr:MAG: hypothetical protein A2Y62_17070 [Candidatus Fischerbacteria bacterium RBG_13_37_8]
MEIWESINDEIPVITYHSYSNDQWKIEDTKGLATIVDFKKGTLTVIYEKENIYAVEDLNNLMKSMQAASEKLLTEQEKEQQTPGNFKKKYIGKEKINGLESDHYAIFESGNKIEDIWLSKQSFFLPMEKLFSMLKEMNKPSESIRMQFIDDEQIDKLIAGLGFPIKVISYTPEGILMNEVKYAAEKEFNDEEFFIPIAYDKLPLIEVYMRAYSETEMKE